MWLIFLNVIKQLRCGIVLTIFSRAVLGSDRRSIIPNLTLPDLNLTIFPSIPCLVSGRRSEHIIILFSDIWRRLKIMRPYQCHCETVTKSLTDILSVPCHLQAAML